jgi:hypothetical protein
MASYACSNNSNAQAFQYIKGDKLSILSNLACSGLLRVRQPHPLEIFTCLQRIPLLPKIMGLLFLCLVLFSLGVMSVARTQAIPKILIPVQTYLPGNIIHSFSKDADCHRYQYQYFSCQIRVVGQDIFFDYELGSRRIVRTTIQARQYKIGELVTAWGYPTGFTRNGTTFVIFWGIRSAVLYTSSLRPDSQIQSIGYDWEPQRSSPWRGFAY